MKDFNFQRNVISAMGIIPGEHEQIVSGGFIKMMQKAGISVKSGWHVSSSWPIARKL
jgi:hypothetical protein